jgi:hypothetical protein
MEADGRTDGLLLILRFIHCRLAFLDLPVFRFQQVTRDKGRQENKLKKTAAVRAYFVWPGMFLDFGRTTSLFKKNRVCSVPLIEKRPKMQGEKNYTTP